MTKKRRKHARAWVAASVMAVAAVTVYGIMHSDSGEPVTVSRPSRRSITEKIPANGKIHPVTEIKISPDVSGEITGLYVNEGDYVKKGDLVIRIKQDVYISLRDRAIAALNAAKAQSRQQQANYARAEQNHRRNTDLYGQGAISLQEYQSGTVDYEIAKEQLNAAEYNIKSAEASLDEAEENLTKTVIHSPIDGIVSSLKVEKGERVVGTSQMAGTEMLRIADFGTMEVIADVNENDIIRISEHDTADIEVDAYPDRIFKGVVTGIASSAKTLAGAVSLSDATSYEVKIRILPESYKDLSASDPIPFRPGMSATVEIETSRKDGILTVPLQAVTSDNTVFVYDRQTSTVGQARIRTGIQDLTSIEIIEGIDGSEWIVTGPYRTVNKILKDGMKVDAQFIHNPEGNE